MNRRRASILPFRLLHAACFALGALVFTGCSVTTNHYVLDAKGKVAATPILPALNTAGKDGYTSAGIRVARREVSKASLQARFDGDTVYSYSPGVMRTDIYHTRPGNYLLDLGSFDVGVDLRAAPNRHFDFFMSADTRIDAPSLYYSGMMGIGITLTTPILHFRAAPAIGMHHNQVTVTDSLVEHWEGPYIDDFDTTYVRHVRERNFDGFGAVSFSAWLPQSLVGPLVPYVQYQYQTLFLQSKLLSEDALKVNTSTWVAGLNWSASRYLALNVAFARAIVFNDLSRKADYKIETGMEFKVEN